MSELSIERSAILRWIIDGFGVWQEEGLNLPDKVADATQEYKEEMNSVGNFIAERVDRSPGTRTPFKDVYEAYVKWCDESNEYTIKRRAFNNKLREMGFKDIVMPPHVNYWIDLMLRGVSVDEF